MLSPNEFTVGPVGKAKPLSLILPTDTYGKIILVGHIENVNTAVFLSGEFQSHCFESKDNENWDGLIVPDVRVEVDETSLIETNGFGAPLLSVVRLENRLALATQTKSYSSESALVSLHDNLESAGRFRAAFTAWRIVIGEGQNTRSLWSTT